MWRSGRLVHLLVEKADSDRALLASADQRHRWYLLEQPDGLLPELRAAFQEAACDRETDEFLENSLQISNNICLQIYYSMMSTLLSLALTKTSINGLLGRGQMFLFSPRQLRALLQLPESWTPAGKRLLDIGAGDGAVTAVLQTFFANVSAVEASKVMEWRLAQRGFNILSPQGWAVVQNGSSSNESGGAPIYDLISALNLLDRHQDPQALLSDLHALAAANGCPVLLSLVLPVNQYVEFRPTTTTGTTKGASKGAKKTLIPPGCHRSFESHANALVSGIFEPAGFELIRWTRLPYLCEGDLSQAFYKLDDAVFLLKAVPKPSSSSTTEAIINNIVFGTEKLSHEEV